MHRLRPHVKRAVEEHTRRFGRPPKGMWPAEGSVCQAMLPLLAQHGIEWFGNPFFDIGGNDLSFEPEAGKIVTQALQPRRRAIDGGDFRADERQLRRLAAGRGAEIGNPLAADIAEKPRR